jgi:hypothetical protein
VNEAKFGFNRGNVYTTNRRTRSPSLVSPPLNKNQFKLGVGNSFSWIDNLSWVKDEQTLKFGGEVRRMQLNQGNTASGFGKLVRDSNLKNLFAVVLRNSRGWKL